ncbi:ARM repeat-containing protein [Backusella circina FSU 941]|nr:ARM repeat-containing protein [Backusella circina FSU 941]
MSGTRSAIPSHVTDSCQQLDKEKDTATTRSRADTLPNRSGIFNNNSYYTWLGQQPEATRFHQSNTEIDARLQAQTPNKRLRAFSMLDSAYSCKEQEQQNQIVDSVTNSHSAWLGNLHQEKPFERHTEVEKEPTRALWVGKIPLNTNQNTLSNIFMPFGHIESIRILNQKSCCFINYFNVQDAINAKKTLEKNEFIKGAGIVPIDFAKVPQIQTSVKPEYQTIIKSFGDDEEEEAVLNELYQHACCYQYRNVPLAPELGQTRKVDVCRLREIRKKLDLIIDWESIVFECQDELVELCNDYIGNTIVQRLFERCSEKTKSHMLEIIAPYLASIGVHKNGTWAAQKIIETCKLPAQPYVPALLLDPFGNYVVQCCLGLTRNQFIFDAIVNSCWEISQGRFGARAIRATLESPFASKLQQKYVAVIIVQHALSLATNPNGALLLIWLLDTSCIPGRYIALAPRLVPHLGQLCTHKLASLTILKLVNQRPEPEAQRGIIKLLFSNMIILEEVLHDQVHGVNVIQKILCSSYIELSERQAIAEKVKQLLYKLKLYHAQGYKRLVEEINMVKVDSVPDLNNQVGFVSDYLSSMNLYTRKEDNKLSNY